MGRISGLPALYGAGSGPTNGAATKCDAGTTGCNGGRRSRRRAGAQGRRLGRGSGPHAAGRAPWEPNWKVWRWIAGAALAAYAATQADGAARALLVLIAFALVCLAADAALPRGDGLRQWRQ